MWYHQTITSRQSALSITKLLQQCIVASRQDVDTFLVWVQQTGDTTKSPGSSCWSLFLFPRVGIALKNKSMIVGHSTRWWKWMKGRLNGTGTKYQAPFRGRSLPVFIHVNGGLLMGNSCMTRTVQDSTCTCIYIWCPQHTACLSYNLGGNLQFSQFLFVPSAHNERGPCRPPPLEGWIRRGFPTSSQ